MDCCHRGGDHGTLPWGIAGIATRVAKAKEIVGCLAFVGVYTLSPSYLYSYHCPSVNWFHLTFTLHHGCMHAFMNTWVGSVQPSFRVPFAPSVYATKFFSFACIDQLVL